MNTRKIQSALLRDEHAAAFFAGVLARDQFAYSTTHGLYVVNTQNSEQSGEHWLVVYISDDAYDFFDSFGHPPPSFPVF